MGGLLGGGGGKGMLALLSNYWGGGAAAPPLFLRLCITDRAIGHLSNAVALLFYVHGKHLRSCRDGQLT